MTPNNALEQASERRQHVVDVQTLPATFKANRSRMVWLLVGSSVFVFAGIWYPPSSSLGRYYLVGFFGLGMAVAIVNLLPRSSYLTLTPEGMIVVSLFRKSFVPWSNVQSFVLSQIQSKAAVGWIYLAGCKSSTAFRRLATAISGVDGMLPDTYGMSAENLVTLLNELRATYAKPAL